MRFHTALFLVGLGASTSAFGDTARAIDPVFEDGTSQVASDNLSPDIISKKLQAVDATYSEQAICEDWELALHLLGYVQAPVGHRGANTTDAKLANDIASCPKTFSAMATELYSRMAALRDFHTSYSAGKGLDSSYYSVVTSCSDANLCKQIEGSRVYPLLTNVSKRFHMWTAGRDGVNRIYSIETINGKDSATLAKEVRESELMSRRETGGNNGYGVLPVFRRKILDGRDRSEMDIVAKDLATGQRVSLHSSFTVPVTVTTRDTSLITKYFSDYPYDCASVEPNSTSDLGACVTRENRALVWIRSWAPAGANSDGHITDFVRNFLLKNTEAAAKPIILDQRNNGGGSPYFATHFACTFGDDKARSEVRFRDMNPSYWPETLTVSSGRVFNMQALIKTTQGNNDLMRVKEGWHASSFEPSATRYDYRLGVLQRFEMTDTDCQALRDDRFVNSKWVMLTSGGEFSATENFLSFMEESNGKFIHVGETSWGGTGAPFIINLPNTGISLRLSQARHIDRRAKSVEDAFKIEALGVKPDQFVLRELPEEFEKRVNTDLAGGDTKTYRPYILRFGLSMRP